MSEKPWTDEDEMYRQGRLKAGLEPRLAHCWKSSTTDSLRATYNELVAKAAELPELADVRAGLVVELRYRTDPA